MLKIEIFNFHLYFILQDMESEQSILDKKKKRRKNNDENNYWALPGFIHRVFLINLLWALKKKNEAWLRKNNKCLTRKNVFLCKKLQHVCFWEKEIEKRNIAQLCRNADEVFKSWLLHIIQKFLTHSGFHQHFSFFVMLVLSWTSCFVMTGSGNWCNSLRYQVLVVTLSRSHWCYTLWICACISSRRKLVMGKFLYCIFINFDSTLLDRVEVVW